MAEQIVPFRSIHSKKTRAKKSHNWYGAVLYFTKTRGT